MQGSASGSAFTRITLALGAIILTLVLLYLGRVFFITLIVSILLAFILDPLVVLFTRIRIPRGLASFLACTMLLGVVYLGLLGFWMQAVELWDDIPRYSERIGQLAESGARQIESVEKTVQDALIPKRLRQAQDVQKAPSTPAGRKRKPTSPQPEPVPPAIQPPAVQEVRIHQEDTPLLALVKRNLPLVYDIALMSSFVPFLVYFMLSWREHFRRGMLDVVSGSHRRNLERAWDGIASVARAYLVGNFLLGVLVSVLSAAFFWYVKLPYWPMVGPMSAFLSLVPYVGLPLALIPPFVAALPDHTSLPFYLVIGSATALLHLLALNLLYPKFVGARVHLNPLVVTVALMLWYLLWGAPGLVLAIPITAGLKAALDNIPSLRTWGKLLGD